MDETVTVENPQAWLPRAEWVKTQPQTLLASCVLLLDAGGRVLLLRYAPGQPAAGHWWLPGGMLDHGEDPWTAARRELREETGLELPGGPRLIGVDHRADVEDCGPVLDCYFSGGTLPADAPVALSEEHDRYAFHDVEDLGSLLTPPHLRTLRALYEAAASGTTLCLREGTPL
ncbi:NUDIX hydrolase [Streptomyces niveiscabiei]|uniref:NUDIX hydrolase n=1 Tax=Streptomyces niveiscabiei TaxID=164115 RepID=A0ABW9HRK4_9ACTN